MCYLIAVAVGAENDNSIPDANHILLPSNRALWEAKDIWTWEREYDAFLSQSTVDQPRLDTVADLAIAKHLTRSDIALEGNPNSVVGALDNWHSRLDSLGMLLTTVIAGG